MDFFDIAKMLAGPEITGMVEGELKKVNDRAQAIGYCTFVNNNFPQISGFLSGLQNEVEVLIISIRELKSTKLSRKDKRLLETFEIGVTADLEFLNLAREYLITLSKGASGVRLPLGERLFLKEFSPYIEGAPSFRRGEGDKSDPSFKFFLGTGQYQMTTYVLYKRYWLEANCGSYLFPHSQAIQDRMVPDMDGALQMFNRAMLARNGVATENSPVMASAAVPIITPSTTAADELIKYKELLDAGLITREEFDKRKDLLLNQ